VAARSDPSRRHGAPTTATAAPGIPARRSSRPPLPWVHHAGWPLYPAPMETADRRKLRHTGWALLTVVFVGIATTGARGSFGLFTGPGEKSFGAGRAAVALVPAIGFVALGLGQPLAGKLAERGAAKRVVLMGLVISAIGFGIGAEAGSLVVVALAIGGV